MFHYNGISQQAQQLYLCSIPTCQAESHPVMVCCLVLPLWVFGVSSQEPQDPHLKTCPIVHQSVSSIFWPCHAIHVCEEIIADLCPERSDLDGSGGQILITSSSTTAWYYLNSLHSVFHLLILTIIFPE